MKKGILSFTIAVTMVVSLFSGFGIVVRAETLGGFDISGPSDGYSYANGILTISKEGDYTLKNASSETSDRIEITAPTGTVNLNLVGINIKTNDRRLSGIKITGDANVKIISEDNTENNISVQSNAAGIEKKNSDNSNLEFTCEHKSEQRHSCSDTCGKLFITNSYYSTGIGGIAGLDGSDGGDCANITISGGNISINSKGVGIGGGDGISNWNNKVASNGGDCSNINILGGNISITAEMNNPGIGGGNGAHGYAGTSISDNGTNAGNGGNCSNINVLGGNISITTNFNNPGIGGGAGGSGGSGYFSQGRPLTNGGNGGNGGDCSNINLSGGNLSITTSYSGYGINGGDSGNGGYGDKFGNNGTNGTCSSVVIDGGSIHSTIGCTPVNSKNEELSIIQKTSVGYENKAIKVSGTPSYYNVTGIYGDSNGNVYLWMPKGYDSNLIEVSYGQRDSIDIKARYAPSKTDTYSVNISWGSMEFEYTPDEHMWKPEQLKYEDSKTGKWTCDENANKITVENRSNKEVKAGFSYTSSIGFETVNGIFSEGSSVGTAITSLTIPSADTGTINTPGEAQKKEAYLYLTSTEFDGKGLNNTKIGTVTVTISDK